MLVVLIALGQTRSVTALIMFALAGFVFGGVAQDLWRGVRARRAVSREPVPLALVSLVRRNRRRYGGYLAHLGIITLFVGVAASSSFKDVQDVVAEPGREGEGRRLRVHLRQADRRAARGAQRAAGADRVRRAAERPQGRRQGQAAAHVEGLLPVAGHRRSGPVSRFFDGESTTEVGLDASLHNDIWAAVAPDTAKLRDRIDEGDKLFDKAADDLTVEQSNEFLALALRGLTDRYAQSPPPARFRLEVNPMVTWIWIGGLIVAARRLHRRAGRPSAG